jgi:proteic killer suppression protein
MIRTFRHKGLKRLFENGETRGLRADYIQKVENILAVLNRARSDVARIDYHLAEDPCT